MRDTGIGIPAEMLARVFDLFTQVDRSLDRSQGGLGIGLTLVRRLVEMHGGQGARPSARARPGQRVRRAPAALCRRQPRPAADGNGADGAACADVPACRVLVVDDNVDAAESLAMLLRLSGHEVRVAHDGPAALEAARGVPARTSCCWTSACRGWTATRWPGACASGPASGRSLLVALTGYGQEDDRAARREAGFDHHLVKPADLEALAALLAAPPAPVGV